MSIISRPLLLLSNISVDHFFPRQQLAALEKKLILLITKEISSFRRSLFNENLLYNQERSHSVAMVTLGKIVFPSFSINLNERVDQIDWARSPISKPSQRLITRRFFFRRRCRIVSSFCVFNPLAMIRHIGRRSRQRSVAIESSDRFGLFVERWR